MAAITVNIRTDSSVVNSLSITTKVAAASVVQAQKGMQYELLDQTTGLAPKHIVTMRSGNDLLITFEGSDVSQPDLIIRDYYDPAVYSSESAIIGRLEDGNFYPFTPESRQVNDSVNLLAEQVAKTQQLTTIQTPMVAASFNPAWIAAPLLAGGIALTVKDKNNNDNAVSDSLQTQIATAKTAVQAAQAAQNTIEKVLLDAQADGLITIAERQAIENANKALVDARKIAADAVRKLPNDAINGADSKDSLSAQINKITPVALPEVNDANDNGIEDADESEAEKIQTAQEAILAAEQAMQEAQAMFAQINRDNLINPDEKAAVEAANAKVTEAKDKAQAAINLLADSADKATLQGRANAVESVTVPAVNDANDNGIKDADESEAEKIQTAQEAILAAEQAMQEAQAMFAQVNRDNLINPDEKAAVEAANAKVATAKAEAQKAIDALTDSAEKTALRERTDKVAIVAVPSVNDQDDNGKDDAAEAAEKLMQTAETAVAAAEQAAKEAKDKLTKFSADNLINPAEKAAVEAANAKVTEAKDKAQVGINLLVDSAEKTALQERANAVKTVTVPAINDQDGNDKDDAGEAAEAAVAAAEQAAKEAQAKLTEVSADNLINPDEKAAVEEANAKVTEAKDKAQVAINLLADNAEKTVLQERTDKVATVAVPSVNDQDGNGKDDAAEAAEKLQTAKTAVAAAEQAAKDAKDKLAEASANNLINPAEKAAVEAANDKAATAKAEAQKAIDALTDSTEKTALQERANKVATVAIPNVNDQDGNGKDDAAEAAEAAEKIQTAKAAVAAAEQATKEAKDKLTEVSANNLINPDEKAAVEAANAKVATAKAEAQKAIDALTDSAEKTALQERANAVETVTVPAVNDANNNGIKDADESEAEKIQTAQDVVLAAEQAMQEAQAMFAQINSDNLINPDEKAAVEAANAKVAEAKDKAQVAINLLADSAEKAALQGRMDKVATVTVPAINDQDSNDKDDAVEAAEAAVAAAEQAAKEAKDKLAEVSANNLINPDEKAAVEAANAKVIEAKDKAQVAINLLADNAEKTVLQERMDKVAIVAVPSVNDQDSNGKDDAAEAAEAAEAAKKLQTAETAVAAAEQAAKDAKDKLAEVSADNLINPDEKAAVEEANAKVTEAKDKAQAAINLLADNAEKTVLQGRANAVESVSVPAVNDANNNGIKDSEETTVSTRVVGDSTGDGQADEAGKPVIEILDSKLDSKEGKIHKEHLVPETEDQAQVKISFPKNAGYAAEQTIIVTRDTTEIVKRALTKEEVEEGLSIPFELRGNAQEGLTNKITVKVIDADGNESLESEAKTKVDIHVPGDSTGDGQPDEVGKPKIEILDGGDGLIENSDVTNGKVTIRITLPKNAGYSVGDRIKLTDENGKPWEGRNEYGKKGPVLNKRLTSEDLKKDVIEVQYEAPLGGKKYVFKVEVTDREGNSTHAQSESLRYTQTSNLPSVVIQDNIGETDETSMEGKIRLTDLDNGKAIAKISFSHIKNLASYDYKVGDKIVVKHHGGAVLLEKQLSEKDFRDGLEVEFTPHAKGKSNTIIAEVTVNASSGPYARIGVDKSVTDYDPSSLSDSGMGNRLSGKTVYLPYSADKNNALEDDALSIGENFDNNAAIDMGNKQHMTSSEGNILGGSPIDSNSKNHNAMSLNTHDKAVDTILLGAKALNGETLIGNETSFSRSTSDKALAANSVNIDKTKMIDLAEMSDKDLSAEADDINAISYTALLNKGNDAFALAEFKDNSGESITNYHAYSNNADGNILDIQTDINII